MNGTRFDTARLERRLRRLDPGQVENTRAGIRVVELAHTRIRIRVAGSGTTTLVFACDPPNVVEQYDEIIQRLGDRYRIVVMEQPGMGFSFPKPGFDFTLRSYVDALSGLLQELDMAPYVLVFPCASTYTALHVAAEMPSLVRQLVLMQATSWAQEKKWLDEVARGLMAISVGIPFIGPRIVGTPWLGQALTAATERWFPQMTHGATVYKSKQRPDLLRKFVEPGRLAFRHGACNCQVSMYQQYFTGDDSAFPRPAQPTLVLWANRDYSHDNIYLHKKTRGTLSGLFLSVLTRPVQSDRKGLLKYVPQATFKEVEETGHFLELENPEVVCRHIGDFVDMTPVRQEPAQRRSTRHRP